MVQWPGNLPPNAAFAQREAGFFVNIMGSSPWIDEFPYLRERVRRCYDRIAPQALRGLLLPNFSGLDDGDASATWASRRPSASAHCAAATIQPVCLP